MALAARPLLGRAVHIKIFPRPRNLAESMQILRVLESYGEVEMFRHLKYESLRPAPNSALAIYSSASAAERAMSATPMRFLYGSPEQVQELGTLNTSSAEEEKGVESKVERLRRLLEEAVQEEESGEKTAARQTMEGDVSAESAAKSAWDEQFDGPRWAEEEMISKLEGATPPKHDRDPGIERDAADDDAWGVDGGPPPPPELSEGPYKASTPPPIRRCSILITPSTLSHSAYIARQAYYGFYRPRWSAMSCDLESRLPHGLRVLGDTRYDAPEEPLDIRIRQQRRLKRRMSGQTEHDVRPVGPLRALLEEREEKLRERASRRF